MTNSPHERELGEVRAELRHLQADISDIKQTQKEMRDTLVGAKGSWKVLTVIAALTMSVITGAIVKISSKLFGT